VVAVAQSIGLPRVYRYGVRASRKLEATLPGVGLGYTARQGVKAFVKVLAVAAGSSCYFAAGLLSPCDCLSTLAPPQVGKKLDLKRMVGASKSKPEERQFSSSAFRKQEQRVGGTTGRGQALTRGAAVGWVKTRPGQAWEVATRGNGTTPPPPKSPQ